MAALDVADGVAARLAAGQPDRRQVLHHVGDVVELDEVELQVLAGRDVPPAAAVALADERHHLELLGRHRPVRHLDPHHLVGAALALAVDAVGQPEHAEHVLGQLARLVRAQLLTELGDVGHLILIPRRGRRRRDRGDPGCLAGYRGVRRDDGHRRSIAAVAVGCDGDESGHIAQHVAGGDVTDDDRRRVARPASRRARRASCAKRTRRRTVAAVMIATGMSGRMPPAINRSRDRAARAAPISITSVVPVRASASQSSAALVGRDPGGR